MNFALEIAHAGFVRVMPDDVQQACLGEGKIPFRKPGRFAGALDEEAARDFELFLFRIAGEAQHLHAVLERLRNGVQHVGRANEHDLREVVLDIEIVVGERVIELGIEDFHQRGRRIPAEVGGHLVHFVQHKNRVDGAGLLHHLDDLARERADIGAAMAADFGFIANAAERNADEFAACGVADGHSQRSLSHAGRPDEAQNRAFGIFHELTNSQKLKDALLDLLETVVLGVQNVLGGLDVANLLRTLLPGHGEQPIEIVAADGGFRGHRRHEFEALELLDGLFVDFLGHARGVDLLLQLVDFALFAAAEFLLDGFELFVEVVLLLCALHLALYARVDAAIDIELFEFDFQDVADAVQTLDGIHGFEQVLFFVDRKLKIGRNGVREARGIVNARGRDHRVVIQALRELDELLVKAGNFLNGLLDLRRRLDAGAEKPDGGAEKAFFSGNGNGAGALDALDEDLDIAVRQLHALHDVGERADGVDFLGFGIVNRGVVLG